MIVHGQAGLRYGETFNRREYENVRGKNQVPVYRAALHGFAENDSPSQLPR